MAAEIILGRLRIRNFKGMADMDISFWNQTEILGDNATGKTTVFDAYTWVLTGKDSLGAATFNIKPLDASGKTAGKGVECSVEATFKVDGGDLELRRVYRENWATKRGGAVAELKGNLTECYVNGVKVGKREYEDTVSGLVPAGLFPVLSDPLHFGSMKWQERRAMLLDMEHVTVEDAIGSDESRFGYLRTDIARCGSPEKLLTKLKADRRVLNSEREQLPVRIDELTRAGGALDDGAVRALRDDCVGLRDAIAKHEADIARMRAEARGGEVVEVGNRIASLRDSRNRYLAENDDAYRKAMRTYEDAYRKLDTRSHEAMRERDALSDSIARMNREIKEARTRYVERSRQKWSGDICPACGQALPPDLAEERRKAFETEREEDLCQRAASGQELGAKIQEATDRLATVSDEIAHLAKQMDALDKPKRPDLDTTPYDAELEALRQRQREMASGDGKSARISELEKEASSMRGMLARKERDIEIAEGAAARLSELQAREKETAARLEDMERTMNDVDDLVRTRSTMLEERVNSRFRTARFRLFRDQINGGVEECCDITVNGVPYNDLNHAMRINAGLDIIDALSTAHGVHVPVFVDNAEAVTRLRDRDGQTVRLVVSEPDKELRIQEVA